MLPPGMYEQVKFVLPREAPGLRIPGDALVPGKEGPRAAVDGEIHIARDLGSELHVNAGPAAGEWVVVDLVLTRLSKEAEPYGVSGERRK